MNPAPDEHWLILLAAYADDELNPATRAKVERWLAAHPEARDELRAQRRYSPNNWRLWAKVEPKMPSEDAWVRVLEGVETGMAAPPAEPARPPVRVRWRLAAALASAAAGATAAAWFLNSPAPPPATVQTPSVAVAPLPHPIDDPLAGLAVLPMSSDDDVDLLRLPGDSTRWLPVGVPPLVGKLVLAGSEDVSLDESEPSAAWPGGMPKMTPSPGDFPMLFVTRPELGR